MSESAQPGPAEFGTGGWYWWLGGAGGAAGCQLPLTGAQQEMLFLLPDIRCRLPVFPKSCTAQVEGGPGRQESFLH